MAIEDSAGPIEQEIREAIAQGLPGFCGDFVSSVMLTGLLKQLGLKATFVRRKNVLAAMGYIPHPGLPDGRLARSVYPDGAKPRLFVREGSEAAKLSWEHAIAKAYCDAQRGKVQRLPNRLLRLRLDVVLEARRILDSIRIQDSRARFVWQRMPLCHFP